MDSGQIQNFFNSVLENFLDFFARINATLIDSWGLTILIGLVLCFFGVRVFSFSVLVFGGLLGGFIGYGFGDLLFGFTGAVIGAVVLGVICGFLLRAVIRIGFFLMGLFIGGFVGVSLLGQSPWVIAVIIGSGILSVLFYNYFVIVATALWGSLLLAGSLLQIIPASLNQYPLALLAIKALIFAGGAGYQVFHYKKIGKRLDAANE